MARLFIGTYTSGDSQGLYAGDIQGHSAPILAATIDNPSYLLYREEGKRLYAVSESQRGKISAYRLSEGSLTLTSQIETESEGLVHVAMDRTGRYLFTASYTDAKVQMTRLRPDGELDGVCCQVEHHGSGPNEQRQESAHAHSVWLSPDERELYVCDLGLDLIVAYHIDYDSGALERREERSVSLPPGAGPRHLAFAPDGRTAYVVAELSCQLLVYTWSADGGFRYRQTLDLLDEVDPASTAAAVRVSEDGRFVYASCRGKDIIAVFSVAPDGSVHHTQVIPSGGVHPRDFILAEGLLLCANRDSGNVAIFDRSPSSGELAYRDSLVGIPDPIALALLP